jgi:hypothetical protein
MRGVGKKRLNVDVKNSFAGSCTKHCEDMQCSVCDPEKIFFTTKVSYVLFCNPTNKTETGTSNRWGTTNSKPHGPIIMMGQSKTRTSTQIIFITFFFLQVHSATASRTSHAIMLSQNHFPESNRYRLGFFHPLLCRIT